MLMALMSDISRHIARLVRDDPRTQEKLSAEMGVSANTFRMQVFRWGNGAGITSDVLERLLAILGLEPRFVPLGTTDQSDLDMIGDLVDMICEINQGRAR